MLLLSSLVLAILPVAFGFSFEVETSDLTECGSMDIVWSGGTAPYFLTIIVRSALFIVDIEELKNSLHLIILRI